MAPGIETFIVWSHDTLPLETFDEGIGQRLAEELARNNRGRRFYLAKVIASVEEPLPDLKWTDDRPAGSGQQRHGRDMCEATASSPHYADAKSPVTSGYGGPGLNKPSQVLR